MVATFALEDWLERKFRGRKFPPLLGWLFDERSGVLEPSCKERLVFCFRASVTRLELLLSGALLLPVPNLEL